MIYVKLGCLLQGIIDEFAKVRDLAMKMLEGNHYASKEIKSRKDYLEKVYRSFTSRMALRRDIVNVSLNFHQNSATVYIKYYTVETVHFRIFFFCIQIFQRSLLQTILRVH